jgi:hypothetical protein
VQHSPDLWRAEGGSPSYLWWSGSQCSSQAASEGLDGEDARKEARVVEVGTGRAGGGDGHHEEGDVRNGEAGEVDGEEESEEGEEGEELRVSHGDAGAFGSLRVPESPFISCILNVAPHAWPPSLTGQSLPMPRPPAPSPPVPSPNAAYRTWRSIAVGSCIILKKARTVPPHEIPSALCGLRDDLFGVYGGRSSVVERIDHARHVVVFLLTLTLTLSLTLSLSLSLSLFPKRSLRSTQRLTVHSHDVQARLPLRWGRQARVPHSPRPG